MEQGSFFALIDRMKYINRWGLMHSLRNETLAEHSLQTMYIAHALAVLDNTRCGGDCDEMKIALAAAYHDCAETLTGDLPTPIKYNNEEIKTAYKAVEAAAQSRLLNSLPDDMRPHYQPLFDGLNDNEKRIVKAADKISGLIKCREESELGNSEFASAEESQVAAIRALRLPAADIFVDEYLGRYFRNIDSL